ncbi:ABC-F family ATP-binding cassette domain-containing protein [Glutamicibacter sp.]|uniref:ABC-F family ATP-binding cassette domain-containing protein n=1 Tax=Glutamicibacter sp. TaxID=1931995 RepID=UPI0028BDD627|nr:ABC-F family ATP-binding cassette domain-containing protein [Glutamicibacter sp.]
MFTSHQSSVVFNHLTLRWPDGSSVLSDITAAFSPGTTGLIGANGTGKSTLLKLISGEVKPTSGTVETTGHVGYLPQELSWHLDATVADVLGISTQLSALHRIEAGSTDQADYDALGEQWDIQSRAETALGHVGLSEIAMDRRAGTLSGGELMLVALAGLQLAEHQIVLLDEPTNNLDARARHLLYDALKRWKGTLIVASHDLALLDLMDQTADLHHGELRIFGGGYSAYQEYLQQEQAAAERVLRTAQQKQKIEEKQRVEAQTKLARRRRYADKDFENKRKPKVIMQQRKSEAQVSAGKLRGMHDEKVSEAATAAQQAKEAIRDDRLVRIDLPDPMVSTNKRLLELRNAETSIGELRGPQRMALTGANGVGKSRMISELIDGGQKATGPNLRAQTQRIGYLPQRLSFADEQESALDFVQRSAPGRPRQQVQAQLARFLLRGSATNRKLGDLSGGERFRVKLASLLLAEPAHQLLILDEPTNNLDVQTVDALVSAMSSYRGGLLVVSHDERFLERLNIQIWAELGAEGLNLIH